MSGNEDSLGFFDPPPNLSQISCAYPDAYGFSVADIRTRA